MGLSCSCDYDPGPGDVCWYNPSDFITFTGKRATKCCSCGGRVAPGNTVAAFGRYKVPDSDFEVRFYGEDGKIPRATWFMCEECAGLYFSLDELGYCIDIRESMRDCVKEYADMNAKPAAATKDTGQ